MSVRTAPGRHRRAAATDRGPQPRGIGHRRGRRGLRRSSTCASRRSTPPPSNCSTGSRSTSRDGRPRAAGLPRHRLRVAVPERRLLRTPGLRRPDHHPARCRGAHRGRLGRRASSAAGSGARAHRRQRRPDVDEAPDAAAAHRERRRPHRARSTAGLRSVTASGDVRLGHVARPPAGRAPPPATSRVEHTGDAASIKTASGDVAVGTAAGGERSRSRRCPATSPWECPRACGSGWTSTASPAG